MVLSAYTTTLSSSASSSSSVISSTSELPSKNFKLFAEYDTLQYLYLIESKDNMHDTYTSTSFNTHLMPIGVHAFNHLDVINKIIDENMPVREVYDINSVQD